MVLSLYFSTLTALMAQGNDRLPAVISDLKQSLSAKRQGVSQHLKEGVSLQILAENTSVNCKKELSLESLFNVVDNIIEPCGFSDRQKEALRTMLCETTAKRRFFRLSENDYAYAKIVSSKRGNKVDMAYGIYTCTVHCPDQTSSERAFLENRALELLEQRCDQFI